MAGQPKVSVITCVYNGERFLRPAIESILGQHFSGFEYWLVNDSSTDGSREIIASYLCDPRVRLLDTKCNVGTYAAANLALARAQGKYIALMDADDLSLPHRLAAQVEFLDRHPDVGLLGTGFQCINERGEPLGQPEQKQRPCRELRWTLLFSTCFAHSTVMFRHDLARRLGYYAPGRYAQDYDLWSRMSFVTEIAEIDTVCVEYRINPAGLSATQFPAQQAAREDVSRRTLARLLRQPADDQLIARLVRMLCRIEEYPPCELDELKKFILLLAGPFCNFFGYRGKEREYIVAKAREHLFRMVRIRENEAPLWSLLVHLDLAFTGGQPQSLLRLFPVLGKLVLGRRWTRVITDMKQHVRKLRHDVSQSQETIL